MATFSNEPGFCPKCGTILPLLGSEGDVKCYNCKQTFGPEGKEARISWQYFTMFSQPTKFNCTGNTKISYSRNQPLYCKLIDSSNSSIFGSSSISFAVKRGLKVRFLRFLFKKQGRYADEVAGHSFLCALIYLKFYN